MEVPGCGRAGGSASGPPGAVPGSAERLRLHRGPLLVVDGGRGVLLRRGVLHPGQPLPPLLSPLGGNAQTKAMGCGGGGV